MDKLDEQTNKKIVIKLPFYRTEQNRTENQNASGRGRLSKNALNSTSDLSGWENGASWDAPLMVAKDKILP